MGVELIKSDNVPMFRKIAMGTWKSAGDPSVYGIMDVDMSKTLALLPEYEKKHGVKITPAHLVGRAVSRIMQNRPEINGMIRGNRIYYRKHVSIFYQVNIPGTGADKIKDASLSGVSLHQVETMSLSQIAKTLGAKAGDIREGRDQELKKSIDMFRFVPWSLSGLVLDFVSFLTYGLNLNLSKLGIPKDPFGSMMITNVGGMGIDLALAPLVPYSRVPLLMALGAVKDKPWIDEQGEIVKRKILPIGVTFDHRMIDGIHASQLAADFKKCFVEPEKYLFAD